MLKKVITKVRFGKPVIVVSGLPRSGTSMLMQMLERGGVPIFSDGIRRADEDNPKGYYELEQVKELDKSADKQWVKQARGKAIKVISMLLEHLPQENFYRVLFIRRPLPEVIASQNTMLERSGKSVDPKTNQDIHDYFAKHLRKIEVILRQAKNFEVLYIEHRAILDRPDEEAARICDFLGRPLQVEQMKGTVDRTLYRNRIEDSAPLAIP